MTPIEITSLKSDHSEHRFGRGNIEIENDTGCVVWTYPGNQIRTRTKLWVQDTLVRAFFVFGARLNLLEIHESDATPREIYMDVIAPMAPFDSTLQYIDHELDVRKIHADGSGAFIVDEDEFEEATHIYQYDSVKIEECRKAARVGIAIAENWEFGLESELALQRFSDALNRYA